MRRTTEAPKVETGTIPTMGNATTAGIPVKVASAARGTARIRVLMLSAPSMMTATVRAPMMPWVAIRGLLRRPRSGTAAWASAASKAITHAMFETVPTAHVSAATTAPMKT